MKSIAIGDLMRFTRNSNMIGIVTYNGFVEDKTTINFFLKYKKTSILKYTGSILKKNSHILMMPVCSRREYYKCLKLN